MDAFQIHQPIAKYPMAIYLPFCLMLSLASALSPSASKTHFRRQGDAALGSLRDLCANYEIIGNRLTALCVASVGVPSLASIDLNQCLNNDDGVLGFGK